MIPARALRLTMAISMGVMLTVAGCSSSAARSGTAGLSDSPSSHGPLEPAGDPGIQCVAKKHHSRVVIGFEVIANTGSQRLRIDRISLVGARSVQLLDTRLVAVPKKGGLLMGDWFGTPPHITLATARRQWSQSVEARGAVLPPAGKSVYNQILVLNTESPNAASSIDHTRVDYHVVGTTQPFVRQGKISYRFAPGQSCS